MFDARSEPLPRRLLNRLSMLDLPAGAHLAEERLAGLMGVSRTPIRRALAELQRAGIVYSARNRGFFLGRASREIFPATVELPVDDADGLIERIAADRLAGAIGNPFGEEELVVRYGVSRRLIERTLADLRDDGLIASGAAGRWRFHPALLMPEAAEASYRFRLTVEPAIPLLASFAPRRDAIARARAEHLRLMALDPRQRTPRLVFRVDAAYHEMLASFGNNPFFHTAVVQQNRLRQLLEYRESPKGERVSAWLREHLAILDAVEQGDFVGACTAMRTHLANALAHSMRQAIRPLAQPAGRSRRFARRR